MLFAKAVKYEGENFPPNTAIMVKDEDVDDLKKAGGWVVEPSVTAEEKDGADNTDAKAEKARIAAEKKAAKAAEKQAATTLTENNDDSEEEPKGE